MDTTCNNFAHPAISKFSWFFFFFSFFFQISPFITPTKHTVLTNTDVEGPSPTCFSTRVPSSERIKRQFSKTNWYRTAVICKVLRAVAVLLIMLIEPKTYRCVSLSPRRPVFSLRTNHMLNYVRKVHWDRFVCKCFVIISLWTHTLSFIYSNRPPLIALVMTHLKYRRSVISLGVQRQDSCIREETSRKVTVSGITFFTTLYCSTASLNLGLDKIWGTNWKCGQDEITACRIKSSCKWYRH